MKFNPLEDVDPVTTDPAVGDPNFPVDAFVTHFVSEGSAVHAKMWTAQGADLKPTVILLHQAYGGDNLESLIIPLLNAGTNVLTYHPRGMFDNQHEYSQPSALEDAHSAVAFLLSADAEARRTPKGLGYRVDPSRIGTLGVSGGGGGIGLAACAANDAISFTVAAAPSNADNLRGLNLDDFLRSREEEFALVKAQTAGRVDTMKRLRALGPEDADRLSVTVQAPKLVNKKLLIVGAAYDARTPLESNHVPIVKALRDAGAKHLTDVILETDHLFLTKRVALARLIVAWLRHELIL